MKLSMSLIAITFCTFLLSSCKKEKSDEVNVSLVFRLQTKEATNLKSTKAETEPVAASIIVSLQKYGGKVVYDKEKLELTNLNGSYLSKALSLKQGGYLLTEFLVVDANNQVIYATPKTGSNLAYLISKPLPFYFDANSNSDNVISPEVIRTDSSSLNDLGYVGFSFNVTKSIRFLMNVFSKDTNQTTFEKVDSSHLYIINYDMWPSLKYDFTLSNTVNTIYLSNDTGKYILYVFKEGYQSWADTLTKAQLESYSTTPLQVVLKPIPSVCFKFVANLYNEFYPGVSIGKRNVTDFYVDEGYGTAVKINSNGFDAWEMPLGVRYLQIWGNLDDIKSIDIHGMPKQRTSYLTSVNLSGATAIEDISFSSCEIDELIINKASLKNFSAFYNCSVPFTFTDCVNLESIVCTHRTAIYDIQSCDHLQSLEVPAGSTIIFGTNPELNRVGLLNYYGGQISVSEVNNVLINLLASVEKSPREGYFYTYVYYNPQDDRTLPTGDGLNAALTLKNKYNWNVQTE